MIRAEQARTARLDNLRILIPINADTDSQNGVQYALRRQREGHGVYAVLLNVAEPLGGLKHFRYRTQGEIDRIQTLQATSSFETAATPLEAAGLDHCCLFKEGDVVFSILDAAEQQGCDEIAMPLPKPRWWSFLSRGIVPLVLLNRRHIPVVTVDSDGVPRPSLIGRGRRSGPSRSRAPNQE
jgi:hypothetical protein